MTRTSDRTAAEDGLLLPGLDGSNPLAFLAALGVLRSLTQRQQCASPRLSWQSAGGSWMACLLGCGDNLEEVVDHIGCALQASDPLPWTLHKKLPFEAKRLREVAWETLRSSTRSERDRLDTLASLGAECLCDDKGMFLDTALRMVRAGDSAGNGLLAYGKRIRQETTRENLWAALNGPWLYEDEQCALRWDPAEYHGYALQWTDPSKERTVSVRGANRLALAGMPLLPTIPAGGTVRTTCFTKADNRREYLCWPMWQVPLTAEVVQSVLAMPELQQPRPSRDILSARGIVAVFRCERLMTSTYYRNFTPAQAIA